MKYYKRHFGILLLSALFFSCTAQTNTAIPADDFDKALKANEKLQVLDVRTPGEYFSGHLKNALQADWNDPKEFDRRIAFIDKNSPVYVYCLAGGRSAAAAAKMRKMGYTNVVELKGGINAWKAANKELEGSAELKQMSMDEFQNAINSAKTVLVDFGAEWCPPCKIMEPVLKDLQAHNPGKFTIVKVDGGNDQEILKKYEVTALPVFIVFKEGKLSWRKDGVVTEKELAEHL